MQDLFRAINIMYHILPINILPRIIQVLKLNRFHSIDKKNYNSKEGMDKIIITLMA